VFKALEFGQKRDVRAFGREESSEVNPMVAPAPCCESSQDAVERGDPGRA
jgi:hypothetical protein